jgi:hypothetical protein
MNYRALRGVCIGVDRHLKAGDVEDLDPATGKFLISIGAVVEHESSPPAADEPAQQPADSSTSETSLESAAETDQKSTPAKAGRKEK